MPLLVRLLLAVTLVCNGFFLPVLHAQAAARAALATHAACHADAAADAARHAPDGPKKHGTPDGRCCSDGACHCDGVVAGVDVPIAWLAANAPVTPRHLPLPAGTLPPGCGAQPLRPPIA